GAPEGDRIADLRAGCVAQVDGDEIHGDAASERGTPACDQHGGAGWRRTRVAIAVTDRGDADVHVLGRGPGGRIADGVARAYAIDRHEVRGERHRRSETEIGATLSCDDRQAVQYTARAHPVAVRGRPAEHGSGVSERAWTGQSA